MLPLDICIPQEFVLKELGDRIQGCLVNTPFLTFHMNTCSRNKIIDLVYISLQHSTSSFHNFKQRPCKEQCQKRKNKAHWIHSSHSHPRRANKPLSFLWNPPQWVNQRNPHTNECYFLHRYGILSTLSCRSPCSFQGSWTKWHLKVPSNLNDSMIYWGIEGKEFGVVSL